MKKSLITFAVALVSLLGANALAQKPAPGEDRATPAAKATAAEKASAKADRKVEGAKAAKSKRKAAGAEATRAPKDPAAGGQD